MVNEATIESTRLADLVKEDPDTHKRHRLQVFPLLPALQCLPLVDGDQHRELCDRVERMLHQTQSYAVGYTESACDQINQIVPQMLTDQLLAGPHAWRQFYVRDGVLAALMNSAYSRDKARQFETGLAFSIQFLAYYRQCLVGRKVPSWAVGQTARIDNFFKLLRTSSEPVLKGLCAWGARIRSHAVNASNQSQPHR